MKSAAGGQYAMAQADQETSYRWPDHVATKMADFIHEEVKEMLTVSRLVRGTDGLVLPDRDDLIVGKMLGKGAFSEVHEVRFKNRSFAMKHLKLRLMSQPENFRLAASELAVEAHMLASFDHPNILKIRGWAFNGIASFADGRHDSFFLLLDCLDETLDQRISSWQKMAAQAPPPPSTAAPQSQGLVSDFWRRLHLSNTPNKEMNERDAIEEQKRRNLFLEKLGIANEIGRALCFLHESCVIFRDLKPNNIGFLNGVVQLFDFGLSRELPSMDVHQPFEMSGKVGTLRYMAVEVACHRPYNISSDVYSWAMVAYEMMTLQKPFGGWTRDMHANLVCGRGTRPEITPEVNPALRALLEQSWSQRPQERPNMRQIVDRLTEMEQQQMLLCNSPMVVEVPQGFSFMKGSFRGGGKETKRPASHVQRSKYT